MQSWCRKRLNLIKLVIYILAELHIPFAESKDNTTQCFPWKSLQHLLTAASSRFILIYTQYNESSADSGNIPNDLMKELEYDLRPVVILNCDQSKRPDAMFRPFLKDMQWKCRERCAFVVLCNPVIIKDIIRVSLDFDLLRPWNLWVLDVPITSDTLNCADLGGTGVPIAIPTRVPVSATSSNTSRQTCSELNAMTVYARRETRLQEMDIFYEFPQESNDAFWSSTLDNDDHQLVNMYNATLRIGIKELPPFLERDVTSNTYKGVCIKILEVFASTLNFSYILIPEVTVGTRIQNGSEVVWTGLFEKLQSREIDLALGALSVTEDRFEIAEFTDNFAEDTSSILSPKPEQQSRILIFVRVFPWQIWLLLVAAILVVGPSMYVLERGFKTDKTEAAVQGNIGVWFYWDLVTSTMQRGEVTPSRNTARILAVFWLLFTVVLVGIYSGLLLAVMSFPGTEEAIDSLTKLVHTRHVHPTAFKPGTTYNYFQNGETAISAMVRDRWKYESKQQQHHFPTDADEAVAMLATGQYAVLSERMIFRYMIAKQLHECDCCPYYEAKEDFLKHYYSFAVPKNSAILESLNVIIRRLKKMGIIGRWLSDGLPNIAACQDKKTKSTSVLRPMGLADFQGALYILALGLGAAVFIVVGEIWFVSWQKGKGDTEQPSPAAHPRWFYWT